MHVSSEYWTANAPAKINLALHVTGRRPDFYHSIETLAVFAELGDRLTIEPHYRDDFAITGPFAATLPADSENLVLRARDALRSAFPDRTQRSVRISLEKILPPASGLGGGSGDAAATLRTLSRLWDIGDPGLDAIALALGADVPMCLHAQPLFARGVGETIEPLADFPALFLVLVNPGVDVSTAAVFARLERRDHPPLPPMPGGLAFDGLIEWLRSTRNDLEPAAIAIAPSIAAARAALEANGAAFARMSGSGATCFGLFRTAGEAERAAAAIRSVEGNWFVEATASGGS